MSEEMKETIDEIVKAAEGNKVVMAFLSGFKHGLNSAKKPADEAEKERA